jgi:putative sterol carrier protein
VSEGLTGCIGHTWNHRVQLRLVLKRSATALPPAATHRALGFYASVIPTMVNREAAANANFTAVMEFTEPGGGAWTFRVVRGTVGVAEELAPTAEVVMTQSPETFVKTMAGMHNPMLAMLTGQIKARGIRKMSTFGKLFAPPKPDQIIPSEREQRPSLAT